MNTMSAIPMTAPTTDDSSTITGSTCQPSHAPSAAEQLEVPVAHAFLAADQLEQPVDGPQRQVAGDGTDHRVRQRRERAPEVDDQARPEQRQRDAVGQELRVEIDHRQREQRPQQHAGGDTLRRDAEAPDRARRQQPAQHLDHRIARRNRRLAFRAPAAQHQPGDDRDVLQRGDRLPAGRTRRARDDQVVGRFGGGRSRRAARRTGPASRARASSAAGG